MGSLIEEKSGRRLNLGSRTLVGRSLRAVLILTNKTVSQEHAVLWWENEAWQVRDLASRNGTWRNDDRLASDGKVSLREGDILRFGKGRDRWRLEDAGPPVARAMSLVDGSEVVFEDGALCIPDTEAPLVLIYPVHGDWQLEDAQGTRPTADGTTLMCAGTAWQLILPQDNAATWEEARREPDSLASAAFCFEVSRDEEFVRLTLRLGERRVPLEPRAHLYMLLTLARRRLDERNQPVAERGWVHRDDMIRMLDIDETHLRVQLYRARRQVQRAGLRDGMRLVERRGQSGLMRFATDDVEVKPLSSGR